jgi:hypothetical protein
MMEKPEPITRKGMASQLRGLTELARLTWRCPELLRRQRGDGAPVIVMPGFGAGDGSTLILRSYLRRLGFSARGWGLGRNHGDVPALIPVVADSVARLSARTGRRVRLIGWSLGGYLAREAARERPEAVDRVITFGSPVIGGPKYTAAAGFYVRRGVDLDAIEAEVTAREDVPIRAPITAIYSRSDGIVSWQACIDRYSPNVEHVEVFTTHLGLGFSPEVYGTIADRLATPAPAEAAA